MGDVEPESAAELAKELAEKEFWLEFPLTKTISPFGKETEVLQMKNPSPEDIRRLDFPFTIKEGGGIVIDNNKACLWIVKMGNLPKDGHKLLYWKDLTKLIVEVVGFLAESIDAST